MFKIKHSVTKYTITSSFKLEELSKSFLIKLFDLIIVYSWLVISCNRFSHFFSELSVRYMKQPNENLSFYLKRMNLICIWKVLLNVFVVEPFDDHDSLDNLQQRVLSFSKFSLKFGMIECSVVIWSWEMYNSVSRRMCVGEEIPYLNL